LIFYLVTKMIQLTKLLKDIMGNIFFNKRSVFRFRRFKVLSFLKLTLIISFIERPIIFDIVGIHLMLELKIKINL